MACKRAGYRCGVNTGKIACAGLRDANREGRERSNKRKKPGNHHPISHIHPSC
jgi:hypothetical protein